MEKVKKSLRKHYPILRLYKSDLEKIFNLFKDNYPEIEIVADGFKLDDFFELSKINKQEIVDFKISADDPEDFLGNSISVEFSKDSTTIYLSDEDDIKLRGLAAQIGDILSDRKSYLRFFATFWAPFLSFLILETLIGFLIKESVALIQLLTVLLVAMLLVWGSRLDTKKHSLIYLYDDSSASSFLKRNKDKILLSAISALMGGIITLVIAWLLKKI